MDQTATINFTVSLPQIGTKVITPFRYPGGKFYALKFLEPFWVGCNHDEYREPFVGGGSVFFAKTKAKYNWINDVDTELINTYKIMQNQELRETLVKMLTKETASKERWKEIRNLNPKNDLERAYKYFYLNRTSFSGKMISAAWGYRPKRSVPPERWHEKIYPSGEKLNGTKITSFDFGEVIKAPAKGKRVLMFIDPPYFLPPKRKHYINGFKPEDHLRLADLLKSSSHSFFLTYEDCPEVRDLYNWAQIYPIQFFYRVDNSNLFSEKRRSGKEVVITNYKLEL